MIFSGMAVLFTIMVGWMFGVSFLLASGNYRSDSWFKYFVFISIMVFFFEILFFVRTDTARSFPCNYEERK